MFDLTNAAVGVLVASALVLTGCQQYDPPDAARMDGLERSSYVAIGRYYTCINRFAHIAKKRVLSDGEIRRFGYHCPAELREAARKKELYISSKPASPYDDEYDKGLRALPQAERIARRERELAGDLWCEFRECLIL